MAPEALHRCLVRKLRRCRHRRIDDPWCAPAFCPKHLQASEQSRAPGDGEDKDEAPQLVIGGGARGGEQGPAPLVEEHADFVKRGVDGPRSCAAAEDRAARRMASEREAQRHARVHARPRQRQAGGSQSVEAGPDSPARQYPRSRPSKQRSPTVAVCRRPPLYIVQRGVTPRAPGRQSLKRVAVQRNHLHAHPRQLLQESVTRGRVHQLHAQTRAAVSREALV
jgi:hypothetical protein